MPEGAAAKAHPGIVAALRRNPGEILREGSLDRCVLAEKAGVLSLALETAQAALAKSTIDQAVSHHLAVTHALAMRFAARAGCALDAAEAGKESAEAIALRAARITTRMVAAYRESFGLLERVRDLRHKRLGGPAPVWSQDP